MKISIVFLIILCTLQFIICGNLCLRGEKKLLNMENTMSPIIHKIAMDLGEYQNIQFGDGPAKGGSLIYKREPCESCISGIGNFYYIRLYEWQWEGKKLWHKPICDIPLNCRSCIPEDEILIPYWDEQLQNAKLGEKYYVRFKNQPHDQR